MDFTLIIIGSVSIGAFALMMNFLRNKRVDKIVAENKDVPQLFLQKSVDNKLRTIQHALRQSITDDPTNDPVIARLHALRLAIGQELEQLTSTFKAKKISLKAYDHQLAIILQKLNQNVVY